MCAQFVLKAKANELSKKLGIKIPEPMEFDLLVRGFMKTDLAPVIVFEDGELKLKEMYFSLCPQWADSFPCKFSTYNARLERPKVDKKTKKPVLDKKTGEPISEFIYQVPTWRDPFSKGKTCLVPMSCAIESSYFGSHAGKIVEFSSDGLFFAVGIWEEYLDRATGEVKETFTLLTDDPYQFFFDVGHDRSVFIINEKAELPWLKEKMKPEERFNFLRNNRITLPWKVSTNREMAKGWEKKAPTKDEIAEIKVWTA